MITHKQGHRHPECSVRLTLGKAPDGGDAVVLTGEFNCDAPCPLHPCRLVRFMEDHKALAEPEGEDTEAGARA